MSVIRTIRKFRCILSPHQKASIFKLAALMLIGGLLETVSVSLILVFMDLVVNPEQAMQKQYVKIVYGFMHASTYRSFLLVIAILFAAIYLFKNVYMLLEYNFHYRFVYHNMYMMRHRMLYNLITKPYESFLDISSGDVIRIINDDVSQVFNTLVSVLSLFTELVVSGMLVVAVFVMAPGITIFIALALLAMLVLVNMFVRPRLKRAGRERQSSASDMNKWLLQSVHGIKEVKVCCKEDFFISEYDKSGLKFVNSVRENFVLSGTPRFILEAACMCTVFSAVALNIYFGAEIDNMIPVLSAVAVAAARLLPAASRISSSMASISYIEPMLDKLVDSLDASEEKNNFAFEKCHEKLRTENEKYQSIPMHVNIVLDDVTYRYPSGEKDVLSNATMEIKKGQSIGIVGTSGSGKTTCADILLGLLIPQHGSVLVDGKDIREDVGGWLAQIGYIPQQIFMLDGSIRENIAFGESSISDDEIWRALSDAALDEFVKQLPEKLDTEIGERGIRLSGGQRQRIGIARALYKNPDILFFDEATSALDDETEQAIMESITQLKRKKTLVIIAHRLTTIETCDTVYRVENGKLIKER